MRFRIWRFNENNLVTATSDFPLSRTGNGSALRTNPADFTCFVGLVVSLSEFLPSKFIPQTAHCIHPPIFQPFPKLGKIASADRCQFSLISQSRFPVFWFNGRSFQVSKLTFSAPLSHLLPKPLIALGFVVTCQITRLCSLVVAYRDKGVTVIVNCLV